MICIDHAYGHCYYSKKKMERRKNRKSEAACTYYSRLKPVAVPLLLSLS